MKSIKGAEDREVVLDRMVANGEITGDQRDSVLVIRHQIVEPIWGANPDGSARLVGRRNVHTGEVEVVEGWGDAVGMSTPATSLKSALR